MEVKTLFGTSESAETGKWFPISGKVEFKIARLNNKRYKEMYREEMKQYRTQQRRGTLDPEIHKKVLVRVFANTILVDWSGLEVDKEPYPYSVENCEWLLTEFEDALDTVTAIANDLEAFKVEEDTDSEENS